MQLSFCSEYLSGYCVENGRVSLRDGSSGQDSKGRGSVPGGRDRDEATDRSERFPSRTLRFGATGGGEQGGFLGFSGWTETCGDQVRWFPVLFSEPPLLGTCFRLVLLSLFLLRTRDGRCNSLLLCGTLRLYVSPFIVAAGPIVETRRAGDAFSFLKAISRVSARAGTDAQVHLITKPCSSHHENVLTDCSCF